MTANQPERMKQSNHPQRVQEVPGEDARADALRAMLLNRRNALTREIDALVARRSAEQGAQREQAVPDTGDLSVQDAAGDQQVSILELRNGVRNEIDEALRRLDDGTYGLCEDCGARISRTAARRALCTPLRRVPAKSRNGCSD